MTNQALAAHRPPLQIVLASLLQADLRVLIRNRRGFILSVALPIAWLLVIRNKEVTRLGGDLFVIGIAITVGMVNASIIGYALTVARDRDQGVFQRLRVTPAPAWTFMASRLIVSSLANLLIAVIAVIVGTRMHNLNPPAGDYILVVLVSVLGGAVFLAIGQALVGLLHSSDTVNAASRVVVILLIFGGLFAQSGILGSTWASIARWSPVGAVVTLFAGVLNTSAWDMRDSMAVVACICYTIVFATIGIRWFQWDSR